MRAGTLRDRVRIEKPVDTTDSAGGTSRQWIPLDVVFADIRAGAAREVIAAKAQIPSVTHSATIRYRSDVAAGMRLRRGAAVLWIVGQPSDPDGRRQSLTLLCEERAGETGGVGT